MISLHPGKPLNQGRPEPKQNLRKSPSPARILVIDDDDIARELLTSVLKAAGHTVFALPSAIGATREIFQNAIDAVVVDVMLPDIDGDKLARVLRQNSRGRGLAIVLVSSRPVEELRALAATAQADMVLPKSLIRAQLAEVVNQALEARAKSSLQPRA
jgi:CheY-like chemotaxis protein